MTNFTLPPNVTKHHQAILGTNGSGKTSVAKRMIVEPALSAGERCCVIDPTGVWWGLRLGKNGKPAGGLTLYIVGGERADFPLNARDGKTWADIVGTSADSFAFDTSQMTVADRTRWFTDFAEALILKNKGPLRLIIDEAHLFAPQGGARAGGLAPDMLHATNNLLALGRSKGLRVTMISQRAAKLHKDALSQAHTLIAMKLVSPQDRDAIRDWVSDQTDPASGKELIASLPTLKPGEGWVWAPADGILERVTFPRPKTYDSSRAPEEGDDEAPTLPKIDPAKVAGRLATVAAEAKANDPKALKAEIATLKAELAKLPDAVDTSFKMGREAKDALLAEGEERGRKAGVEEGIKSTVAAFDAARSATAEGLSSAVAMIREQIAAMRAPMAHAIKAAIEAGRPGKAPYRGPAAKTPHEAAERFLAIPAKARATDSLKIVSATAADLPTGERAILIALAERPKIGATRQSLTVLTGYKRSTRDAYILRLFGKGFIGIAGDRIFPNPEGVAALGDFTPLPVGQALIDHWLRVLPQGEAAIFRDLVEAHPASVSRDRLTESTGYQRSTRDAYLLRLAAKELIERRGSDVVASENLFT